MRTSASLAAPALGLIGSAALLAGLASLPSCSSGGDTPRPDGGGDAGPMDAGTVYISPDKCKSIGAANEVGPNDPSAQGQCLFLLDAWGTEALGEWPPTDFMLGLMKSEPAVFGEQFASFGFIADPHDDLPIGFKRGLHDPTQVHETCAMCHTGTLPDGRLWFGAPNVKLDIGRFQVEVDKRWTAAGNPPLLSTLSTTKALGLGPGRFNAESGDYPCLVAADFPPYFTLKQRTHLNYIGTGNNVRTEAYFAIYSFGAGSPNDMTAKVPFPAEDRLQAFLAFFGSFQPPAGPAQDAAMVAQGKAVFDTAKCGSCHHPADIGLDEVVIYDKDPSGKERVPGDDPDYPTGSIRTDIMHRVLIDDTVAPVSCNTPPPGPGGDGGAGDGGAGDAGVDTGYADLIAFISAHGLSITPSSGYRTSDLRGLWATAPYLHNGSVPTLDDLLKKAAQRPATWMRGGFPFDTTAIGNGNGGHEWGTNLADADKQALLAYLKSL